VTVGQGDEQEVAGLTFDKCGNRGHAFAEDEIAFRKSVQGRRGRRPREVVR